MIDNALLAILPTRPGRNRALEEWADGFRHLASPFGYIRGGGWRIEANPFCASLAVRRNQTVRRFLRLADGPHGIGLRRLLLADGDAAPREPTRPILAYSGDLASARCLAACGQEAHARDGEISLTLIKISVAALRRIGAPWFAYRLRGDGMAIRGCCCAHLGRRSRAVGIDPERVGWVGHLKPMERWPDDCRSTVPVQTAAFARSP
jgi:hypothetical protein